MAMTRAQFARDLQDGINTHFGMSYDEWEKEYTQIYETKTERKRAFVDQVLRIGFGEAQYKPEGGVVTFDSGAEGWVSRVTFDTYALAFAITEEAIEDNLYDNLAEVYGPELAKALQHAKEVRGADIINNAFNSNYVGGDQQPLCSTAHPLYAGGSYSNKLSTSADLSEEAIEDAMIQIAGWTNDRNRPIVVKTKQMIIPRQLRYVAHRIRNTVGRVGTANNDINALKDRGDFGGIVENHYLTDPDAWFVQTKQPLGLMFWQRRKVKRGMEGDFRTSNMMYKASERFGFSWTDPRCIFGSAGV